MRIVRSISALAASLMLAVVLSLNAFANAAEMHAVSIVFDNIDRRELYAAILTEHPIDNLRNDTGAIIIGMESHFSLEDVRKKISAYRDSEGYRLCFAKRLDGQKLYIFDDVPCSFKVLIYDPVSDTFSCSEAMKKYAVISNFRIELGENGEILSQNIDYDFAGAVFSFICRMVFTVAVELLIALAFGYKDKRHLIPILITNIITQIMLNLGLNLIDFFELGGSYWGAWVLLIVLIKYAVWELIVFGAEALTYYILFKKIDKEYDHSVLYAFVANLVSFISGAILALVLPGIF